MNRGALRGYIHLVPHPIRASGLPADLTPSPHRTLVFVPQCALLCSALEAFLSEAPEGQIAEKEQLQPLW